MKLYHFLLTSVLTAGFSSCLLAPLLFSAASNDSALQAATALVRSGQYAEAHRLLTSALEKSSKDPRLWTLDGFALSRMGREKDALASYESALRIAPRYLPALEGAGEVKFRNRTADAADVLREVIAIRPDEQAAHAMLATLSFEHHDCQTAEAEFAKSEQAIANQSVALNQRGACLIQLNRPREAVAVFEQVIKLLPDGASAHYNLAFSLLQAGNARQAIEVLTRLPPGKRDADTLDLLSDAYERVSDTPSAVATLREAIVQHPDNARLYVHFANLCLAHSSFAAGVDMLNVGIARSASTASLYLARGILEVQLANYAAAESDFSRAETLKAGSKYAAALENMMRLQQDQLQPAAADLRRRIKQHPQDAFLYYLLAETLARSGAVPGSAEFSDAVRAAQTAVRLQPDLGLARGVLGKLYLQEGNVEAAIEQSRLAYQSDPADVTALYHLIRALKKAGRTQEIPALTRKLADLRQQAQKKEMSERQFAIVSHAANGGASLRR